VSPSLSSMTRRAMRLCVRSLRYLAHEIFTHTVSFLKRAPHTGKRGSFAEDQKSTHVCVFVCVCLGVCVLCFRARCPAETERGLREDHLERDEATAGGDLNLNIYDNAGYFRQLVDPDHCSPPQVGQRNYRFNVKS